MSIQVETVLTRLEAEADPARIAGMTRVGIKSENSLGIKIPVLRQLARELGKNHTLALELWATGIHEARILASMIDQPAWVTEKQMEDWVVDFDSWDVCDQVCSNLFDRTPWAWQKASEWSHRPEEFVKRAGFVLMACLAVHDKKASAEQFEPFFSILAREANDPRNYVKKAINWAVRQIGKRNQALNARAILCAQEIAALDTPAARWVAADALRELTNPAVQARLKPA
ncbi:MAG TPA: DNA alkylation repair protein [Anaerolineales bacterium]|nr:DNA alkylation repair protein [Anaerolineales bacterium]